MLGVGKVLGVAEGDVAIAFLKFTQSRRRVNGGPEDSARRILDRFIGLTLVEIGDLPRQAMRDAERA
jgi:hypothetical protein